MSEIYKTYIKGFDERIGGGIPRGYIVLVAGTPGTMKSLLTYHMLYRNAKEDNVIGLFFTLDQSKSAFLNQVTRAGMSEVQGKLYILDSMFLKEQLRQVRGQSWLEMFKTYAKTRKFQINYELLVLDSLQIMELLTKMDEPEDEIFRLFEWLKELDVTAILISEMSPASPSYSKYNEELLSDGIFYLSSTESEGYVERRLRCIKLRGVAHDINSFRLGFGDGSFYVEPLAAEKRYAPMWSV